VGPVFYCSDVFATVQIAVQLVTQLVDVGLFVGLVGEAGIQDDSFVVGVRVAEDKAAAFQGKVIKISFHGETPLRLLVVSF